MRVARLLFLVLLLLSIPIVARAQAAGTPAPAAEDEIDPDRPDITNSAHIVPVGWLQIEAGGLFTRTGPGTHVSGTPFSVRYGVTPWVEARVDGDGWLSRTGPDGSASGIGNVQLGAKIRLLGDKNGVGRIGLAPAVSVPLASQNKGLGSGQPDVILTLLASMALLEHAHADVDVGIGSIGAAEGQSRFRQNAASISTGVDVGRLSPYLELYWFSRQDAGGRQIAGVDGGAIYVIRPHVAIDGGLQAGLSAEAHGASVFGGISFVAASVRTGTHHVKHSRVDSYAAPRMSRLR